MPSPTYPHLELVDWPFRVVPIRGDTVIWAGRQQLKGQVERLVRNISRRSVSSLHLMWADFGAGKTHTLYYIESLAKEHNLLPIYVEWPKKTATFVDVYRGIASHFSRSLLSRLFWSCCDRKGVDEILGWASEEFPDFAAILECLYRDEDTPLIHEWLRAELGVTRRELATIGVRNPIKTSDDAIQALVILAGLVASSGDYGKLLLMLDEFQRVDHLPPRVRRDVNTGIHTLFNACPESLTIILSFSFGRPDNIRFLLADEVRSRADLESIQLPEMSDTEAMEFVLDLLKHYRGQGGTELFFPFTKESCQVILRDTGRLTPRRIMKRFDVVLRRAEEEIRDEAITHITPEYALRVLREIPIREDDES